MKRTRLLILALGIVTTGMAQRPSNPGHEMKKHGGGEMKTPTDTIGFDMLTFDLFCRTSVGGGYVGGNNGYGDLAKAQQYLLDSWTSTKVEEALFWFCGKLATSGDPASHITARVYGIDNSGTASFGSAECPGTTLGQVDIPFDNVDTSASVLFTVGQFPTPVYVGESFCVGFSMEGLTAGDTLGLVLSEGSVIGDYAWEQFSDGNWYTTLSSDSWDLDGDWSIYAVLDNSTVGINDAGTFNGMRLSILNGNPTTENTVQLGYTVDHDAQMEVVVHDGGGREVYLANLGTQGAGEYRHEFGTTGWTNGNYYVTVKADGKTLTKKLTLAR